MLKQAPRAALLLVPLLLAGCDSPSDSGKQTGLTLNLAVDSVVTIRDQVTYTATVTDSRARPVAGVPVQFQMTPEARPVAATTSGGSTDGNGRVTVTEQALTVGKVAVTASSTHQPQIEPATATVRVRATARFSVDQLSMVGPCSEYSTFIGLGDGGDGFSRGLTVTVEDPTIVHLDFIPRSGGTTGLYGKAVWARGAGTTRIIGTYMDAADTIVVTVSPRTPAPSLTLRRFVPGGVYSGVTAPEAVSLAVGETAMISVASVSCDARALPVDYATSYQSSNPTVVAVEALGVRLVDEFGNLVRVGEARLTGVGKGTAQITVTAPFSSPTTYTVTVQ